MLVNVKVKEGYGMFGLFISVSKPDNLERARITTLSCVQRDVGHLRFKVVPDPTRMCRAHQVLDEVDELSWSML